jgi:hypothetical protein
MAGIEISVQELKDRAAASEGRNVADGAFARQVESLLDLFYKDIGEIKRVHLRSLFDLFLLKALYVDRRSSSLATLDYLSDLMARHLRVRDIFPIPDLAARFGDMLEALLDETDAHGQRPQNLFEASRNIADSTLFLLGIFPASLSRRRWARRRWGATTPQIDRSYYSRLGRRHYASAAEHDLARWTGQDKVLLRLSAHFDLYAETLNDVAQTYIHGFDVHRVTNLMLDSYNAWRRTGDPADMENVRKYAALLAIDPRRAFPKLAKSRRNRYVILS